MKCKSISNAVIRRLCMEVRGFYGNINKLSDIEHNDNYYYSAKIILIAIITRQALKDFKCFRFDKEQVIAYNKWDPSSINGNGKHCNGKKLSLNKVVNEIIHVREIFFYKNGEGVLYVKLLKERQAPQSDVFIQSDVLLCAESKISVNKRKSVLNVYYDNKNTEHPITVKKQKEETAPKELVIDVKSFLDQISVFIKDYLLLYEGYAVNMSEWCRYAEKCIGIVEKRAKDIVLEFGFDNIVIDHGMLPKSVNIIERRGHALFDMVVYGLDSEYDERKTPEIYKSSRFDFMNYPEVRDVSLLGRVNVYTRDHNGELSIIESVTVDVIDKAIINCLHTWRFDVINVNVGSDKFKWMSWFHEPLCANSSDDIFRKYPCGFYISDYINAVNHVS